MEVDEAEAPSTSNAFIPKTEKSSTRNLPLYKFQFAEMNLKHTGNPEKTLNLIRRAIRMGYDSVVINIDVGDPFQSAENIELVRVLCSRSQ